MHILRAQAQESPCPKWGDGREEHVVTSVFQLISQARHRRVALHQRAQAEESRCMTDLELIELRSMMTELFSV